MNFAPLPDDWPVQRDRLQRIATHVLANAQHHVSGHVALTVLPGGFGTPEFGPDRSRVRIAGGSLHVERADGERDGERAATSVVVPIAGSSIRELCEAAGVEPDPDLTVGDDTPVLGDPDEMIVLDSGATGVVGDWFALGQRAIDAAVASLPDPRASVVRLWPEHFDVGVDLAPDAARRPELRCNLGASAGDPLHQEPYLYVGPWGEERPGPDGFWNAPFGAVLGFGDLDVSENPLASATEFFLHGIARLRM